MLSRTASSWVLNVSTNADYITAVDKLFQCLTTLKSQWDQEIPVKLEHPNPIVLLFTEI